MRTLSITSNRPMLDITTTRAQLQIKQTVRRHFTAKRTPPQMEVDHQNPKMTVNWKEVWNRRGYHSPDSLRKSTNQKSYSKVHAAIQKMVQDGDFMGALEEYYGTDANRIADLIYQDTIKEQAPEINVAPPMPMPEVEWERGSMTIEWTPGDLEIVWEDDFRPQLTVTPHSVEIRLRGRNEVRVSVNEDNVPGRSGKKIDRKI